MVRKITPEIEKFIYVNRALSGGALRDLIANKFKISVTSRSVESYLSKARAEAEATNSARIAAVQEKILVDADKWSNQYLQYTHDEIESLRKLIKASEEGADPIALENAKDRMAASTALHRMLSTIIDFVKPEAKSDVTVNIKPDLSKLSTDELRYLRSLRSKAGSGTGSGTSKT